MTKTEREVLDAMHAYARARLAVLSERTGKPAGDLRVSDLVAIQREHEAHATELSDDESGLVETYRQLGPQDRHRIHRLLLRKMQERTP